MKKIIMLCTILFVFTSTYAVAEEPTESNITITQDMLLNMDDNARNALFDGLKEKVPTAPTDVVTDVLKNVVSEETLEVIANIDVTTFKGKAMVIADTLVEFCERLGVTVNEFIGTGAGTLIVLGIVYKIGVFGSIWGTLKGILISIFLAYLMFQLNTRKKVVLKERNVDGKVIHSEEILVPKFNAISTDKQEEVSVYRTVATMVCFVVLCFSFIFA